MSEVEPPRRPPIYAQPIGGDDCFLDPTAMLDELAGLLTVSLDIDRSWEVENWQVTVIGIGRRSRGQPLLVKFRASHNDVEHGVALHLSVHPSGWIEARITVGALTRHVFIERIYEEFELWPPDSPCSATDSGRMGKRCTWVQLEADHWPDLVPLSGSRFININPASDPPVIT